MTDSLPTKFPLGSFWTTHEGHKTTVLAYDFVTDNLITYDCYLKKEVVVTRLALDNGLMPTAWSEHKAFESGLIEALRPGAHHELREAYMQGCENKESLPCAHFVNEKGEKDTYGEHLLLYPMENITAISFHNTLEKITKLIRSDIEKHKIDKIIWRVAPEFDVAYDITSGERMFKVYARFAAFSGDNRIAANELAGYCDPNRLTKIFD